METLSVVIPTKNVANIIEDCLKSVAFADEIIVVDMASTDSTGEICQKFRQVKFLVNVPEDGNFTINRKIGFDRAQGDWILKLDSDERLTPELQNELILFLKDSTKQKANGYYFKVKLFIFGKFIRYGLPQKELRLVRKGFFEYGGEDVHGQIKIKGRAGAFKNYYLHFNHRSIFGWIQKMNYYTEYDLKVALRKGRQGSFLKMLLTPLYVFFKSYFVRLGFLEGIHGLILAILLAYYSFIEKAKIWEANYKLARKINF